MSDDWTNTEPVQSHTYTHIEDVGYVCDDCGAWGEVKDEIVHYPSCEPGCSARWQQMYSEEPYNPDEDLTLDDDDDGGADFEQENS